MEAKGARKVSVCIPARNEAATVGAVVDAVRRELSTDGGGVGLVDELLVVDDGSSDDTADVSRRAGAVVIRRQSPHGKGRAMRAALHEATGDVLVFLDGDVPGLDYRYVTRLIGPLFTTADTLLVKGFYERPMQGRPTGGGRVTELVAKPLLEMAFPELGAIRQPLAGETAAFRHVLEELEFESGYGVELGMLIDVARIWGASAIGQVDLGIRAHRNRPLHELRPQAKDVLAAALARMQVSIGARREPI